MADFLKRTIKCVKCGNFFEHYSRNKSNKLFCEICVIERHNSNNNRNKRKGK